MIISSPVKWVPHAASKGSVCSAVSCCNTEVLRSVMGTPRIVHLGIVNSLFPNCLRLLVNTALLIFTQKKRETLDEEHAAATKHKEAKGKQKTGKAKAFLFPLSSCSFTHVTYITSLSANSRLYRAKPQPTASQKGAWKLASTWSKREQMEFDYVN